MPRQHALSSLALAIACLALSGCIKFGAKPPPQLLTIGAENPVLPDKTVRSDGLPTLTVLTPEVPRKLETQRVPVQVDPTTVAYVKEALWTDAPRDLFRRLLAETIAGKGAMFVLSEDQYSLSPGRRLMGELVEFGVDAQTREAVVTFDAVMTAGESGQAVRQRFTAREAVPDIEADSVAAPINRAANKVATAVSDWVSAN